MSTSLLDAYDGYTGRVEKHALPNGLKLIILEDRQAPVAAYQTWFGVGSGHEKEGATGMAHLFEHLMFKETRDRKAGEFDRLLELNGVSTNAATWLDWTFYREELPSDRLELVMQLEADRMENMILSQAQLDTEREVVKNERRLRVDNDPDGLLYELLYFTHFGAHPYGHPTIGWMEDIESISLDECIRFYESYYAPDNACIVVVGDVEKSRVLDLADRYYGHLRPFGHSPDHRPPVPRGTGAVSIEKLPVGSPRIACLFSAPDILDPTGPLLHVVNEFMCNSDSGRLQKLLVEDLELATDVTSWFGALRLAGAFEVQLSLVPGADWRRTLDLVLQGVMSLVTGGCTKREVQKGVNRVEMAFLRGQMHVGTRARHLGHFETTGGDFKLLYRGMEALRNATPEQLRDAAKLWLCPEDATILAGVPSGEQS